MFLCDYEVNPVCLCTFFPYVCQRRLVCHSRSSVRENENYIKIDGDRALFCVLRYLTSATL